MIGPMGMGRRIAIVWLGTILLSSPAFADEDQKSLDGVTVEAVETYRNPRSLELAAGAGIYPLDPFYTGFSLNGGLTYYISTSFAWEILGGSYAFSVVKELTSQLARDYGANPATIEKLEYALSSNLVLVPSYGKTVLFRSFLQNFRSSFFAGGGLVKTTLASLPCVSVGFRTDTYITDAFSWRWEIRDYYAVKDAKHFVSINVGTTVSF